MENVGIFLAFWNFVRQFGTCFGHFVYVLAIWCLFWPFGICFGHSEYVWATRYILWALIYFSFFGMLYPENSFNPDFDLLFLVTVAQTGLDVFISFYSNSTLPTRG
jgi:hypothetical protein